MSVILLRRYEALRWWHEGLDGLLRVHALYELAREQKERKHRFLRDVQWRRMARLQGSTDPSISSPTEETRGYPGNDI